MAGSYNKMIALGYLGQDPQMRFLPSGDPTTSFSIATSERWKAADGKEQERTSWFNCSAFGSLAEICNQYLKKGAYVYLEGTLSQREYTDKQGALRTSLDLRVREMRMLDRAPGAEPAAAQSAPAENVDEIPF